MTDTGRPLGFLDVDGVLNPYDADERHPDVTRTVLAYPSVLRQGHWRRADVVLDRRHAGLLDELSRHVQVVWGTAWEDDANPAWAEHLGLAEDLPVARVRHHRSFDAPSGVHWKTPSLAAYAAGRPFCWLDDETSPADAAWLAANGHRAHLVFVDPAEGLSQRHIDDVAHWAATLDLRPAA